MYIATLLLAALAGKVLADPKPPTFTYLYSINLTMPAGINIGNTPAGSRAILPISGGSFRGPKFNGSSRLRLLSSIYAWDLAYWNYRKF
jgi:hypothetical protein